jgi:hypothetical protein
VERDALGLHLRDAAVDDVLLHLEVGNAVAQQAAGRRSSRNRCTSWPARASCCAQARPAGPEPTTATFLPVFLRGDFRLDPALSQARSTIAHSMVLMVTGLSSMLSVQDASHGAGQMRPVNSGKLLVECRLRERFFPTAAIDQIVEVRDLVVDRAAGVPGATAPVPWQ